MPLLLTDKESGRLGAPGGCSTLHVRGVPYRSSAVMFWSRLLDEAGVLCPDCDRLVLRVTDEAALSEWQLDPASELQSSLADDRPRDYAAILDEMVVELSLFGPPPAIRVALHAGNDEAQEREILRECADSSIFPHLLVWLLAWGDVPPPLWNSPFVGGSFVGEDFASGTAYSVVFSLNNRHLSEGLYERKLVVEWERLRTIHDAGDVPEASCRRDE